MSTFTKGWQDYLNGVPPAVIKSTALAVAYERGRHAAALWEYECRSKGTSIKNVAYRAARAQMGVDLRRMLDAERCWCAMRRPKSLAAKLTKRITSKG